MFRFLAFRCLLGAAMVMGSLQAEKVEILRDSFGVPHIFAKTDAGAAFGAGYAQAEDRLEEMMKNYRRAEGTMAEVFGPQFFQQDYRQRVWRHREVSQEAFTKLPADLRQMLEAFQKGVEQYMKEHPEKVPTWAPKLEPWRQIALARYIIFGWPEGEVAGELIRAGVQPELPAYRGSNQMLVAPSRTSLKVPYAVIDPHLSWYGEFRFYESRIYGQNLKVSGASIVGLPFPSLGHSRWASVAMTTGGPDTSDVYEEEIADGKYQFKGEWKPLVVRRETIKVKTPAGVKEQEVVIEETHHGPILARKNGKAYAAAIPYAKEAGLIPQSYRMMLARNLPQMKQALAELQLMQQNIMVATVGGDIYYVRNGRVPVRPKGCDPSKPMNGASGECEWQGLHRLDDLIQLHNPASGYMQNNNIAPQYMMKDSPLTPDKYTPYVYNSPNPPIHQRGLMSTVELDAAKNLTPEQMIDIAFSPAVYHAELWQEKIRQAGASGDFAKMLLDWNRRSEAGSRAALGFYLFKLALGGRAAQAFDPPDNVSADQIKTALTQAEAKLKSDFPADATYGTLFRVGREGAKRTFPVGGGTVREAGMATPRAINFRKQGNEMVGNGGQTSTQIVLLTKPPQSFMIIPLGESDDPSSPHFDDQAEKLFSKSQAKPTYFLRRAELEKNVTRRVKLNF
jgi:acyl-homoserine lactone acylase PvdQ